MTRTFIPTSVEGFRHVHGRAPTVQEFRACIDFAHPPKPRAPRSNGCDCYDPECQVCCDEDGNVRVGA